ncbi:hypothetical protein [Nocardia carnea]|uniref:hypothetical protein n=1 Tax=Nocardia carnea TaxID=37328 RepID=UPI0005256840|nr:hypothetical protein [Nocardia carnea]
MSDVYDARSLWMKSRLFINHAMDEDDPRDFDERALWAALALELLAKAALSRHSPVLIATPTEEGNHILIASGLISGDAKGFSSVTAKTLIKRCAAAFPPFSEKEASTITQARNNYLHGGSPKFAPIPPTAWWPRYWAQAIILVNAQDKSLEDLVGLSRVPIVETHLAQNKKNIEDRAEMLVARAVQRLAQYKSGDLPAKIAAEWVKPTTLTAGLTYRAEADCPACGSTGTVEGDQITDVDRQYDQLSEDYAEVRIELTVASDYFSCPRCRLVVDGWEVVKAAGVDEQFISAGDHIDFDEGEYGND